jgi:predicted DNA-binding protein
MQNGNRAMTRQFNFRFSDEAFEQLETLSAVMGIKMADVVRTLVARAYRQLDQDAIRAVRRRREKT